MAYIKPTLTLNSNASGATDSPGPLSVALTLSAIPHDTGRLTVDNVESSVVTVGTANTTIINGGTIESAWVPGVNGCWVYIKNTMPSTNTEKICVGLVDSASAAPAGATALTGSVETSFRSFTLKAGEFAFFPYDYTGDIIVAATAASQVLEWWRFDR